jgi:hypothetical protein
LFLLREAQEKINGGGKKMRGIERINCKHVDEYGLCNHIDNPGFFIFRKQCKKIGSSPFSENQCELCEEYERPKNVRPSTQPTGKK